MSSIYNFLSPAFSPYFKVSEHVTSRVSVASSELYQGSVWRVQSSECYFMFTFTFFTFLLLLLLLLSLLLLFFVFFFDEVSNFRNIILTYQKPRFVIRNCQWNCVATLIDFGSMGRVIIQIRDRAFKTHTQAFGILLSLQKLG